MLHKLKMVILTIVLSFSVQQQDICLKTRTSLKTHHRTYGHRGAFISQSSFSLKRKLNAIKRVINIGRSQTTVKCFVSDRCVNVNITLTQHNYS